MLNARAMLPCFQKSRLMLTLLFLASSMTAALAGRSPWLEDQWTGNGNRPIAVSGQRFTCTVLGRMSKGSDAPNLYTLDRNMWTLGFAFEEHQPGPTLDKQVASEQKDMLGLGFQVLEKSKVSVNGLSFVDVRYYKPLDNVVVHDNTTTNVRPDYVKSGRVQFMDFVYWNSSSGVVVFTFNAKDVALDGYAEFVHSILETVHKK